MHSDWQCRVCQMFCSHLRQCLAMLPRVRPHVPNRCKHYQGLPCAHRLESNHMLRSNSTAADLATVVKSLPCIWLLPSLWAQGSPWYQLPCQTIVEAAELAYLAIAITCFDLLPFSISTFLAAERYCLQLMPCSQLQMARMLHWYGHKCVLLLFCRVARHAPWCCGLLLDMDSQLSCIVQLLWHAVLGVHAPGIAYPW